MTGGSWFKIRVALMILSFASSMVLPPPVEFAELVRLPSFIAWIAGGMIVLGLLLMPFLLQLIFAIQSVNPLSKTTWTVPTHQSNPFQFGNPLLFFHFAAYLFGACGLGMLFASLWWGLPALLDGLTRIVAAFSVLLGVRLAMRLFKSRIPATT